MTTSQPQVVNAEISDEMNKIVRKLTELTLAERFATAQDCAEALQKLRPKFTIKLENSEEEQDDEDEVDQEVA